MIEFRTLGGLDIRDATGAPVAGAFSRPKPLALLVYLALARPRGYHAQDALLALFWPASDTERARTSLRQAVHVLRRTLGDEVVVRRGRNELGLDASRVCCDAVLFEQAVAQQQAESAIALYHGDLLPAYYVPDAPDAERWLDGERARLRALAVDAVRALIDGATEPEMAVRWARRAMLLAPDDEALVRRGLQQIERTGDVAAALRLYDEFAAGLARTDDGSAPSARLQQLALRWRALVPTAPTEPAIAHVIGAPTARAEPIVAAEPLVLAEPTVDVAPAAVVAPTPTPVVAAPDAPVSRPPVPRTARRFGGRQLALATLALATVAGATTYASRQSSASAVPDVATATGRRLVVLPFAVRGGDQSAYLREAMVELLSAKLDGVAGVTAVDPRALLTYVQANPADSAATPGDLARAEELARHFGAGQFVLGSVIAAGGRLEATAALYDSDGHRRATADASGGSEDALFAIADALARELVSGELRGPDARLDRVATATTTSLPALKAFLDGEQRLRAQQQDAAVEAYERAVQADTTFALAYYRLSTTTAWNAQPAVVRTATQRARRYADRLPSAERLLLRGNAASDAGAIEDAEGLYQAALAVDPEMPEASRQLGEVRFHLGPWRGRPLTSARDAFARVVATDSSDVNAQLHLARIAALEGQSSLVDSIVTVALASHAEPGVVLELQTLRAVGTGDPAALRRALEPLRAAVGRRTSYDDDDAWLVAWRVATFADDPAAGRLLSTVLTGPSVAAHLQVLGHTSAAHMDAARGRWAAADADLVAAARLDPLYAAEVRANLAVMATMALDARAAAPIVAGARAALARFPAPALVQPADVAGEARAATGGDRVTHDRDVLRAVRQPYLLGVLALAAGDTAAVGQEVRTLAAATRGNGPEGQLARHLAQQLNARIRWAHGDAEGALHEVEAGWPGGTGATGLPLFRGETYTQSIERVLRGDLLRALGRDREALAWYESATEDLGATIALSASVHLRRAAVLEHVGDRTAAAGQYARAAAVWADADAALQPAARDARRRAVALR